MEQWRFSFCLYALSVGVVYGRAVRVSLKLCVNLVSNLFHLLFRELQLGVGEEHVLLRLHGNEVDVGVRNLQSEHSFAYFDAGECVLDGNSHLLGEHLVLCNLVVAPCRRCSRPRGGE